MNHPALKIALMVLVLSGRRAAVGAENTNRAAKAPDAAGTPSFTARDADTVFAAYNKAFYAVEDGKGYYKEDTSGGRNHFWTQAEEIEMILDVYERTRSSAHKSLINETINGFVDHFGTNWMSNKYNDDLMWMVIATSRAFLVTSNTAYRDLAKFHFDETYTRAWSTNLGGGLWWSTDEGGKNACVNGPAAIGACYLHQIVGDSAYLDKAREIYAWEKTHLFSDSGAVRDNMRPNGRTSRRVFTYNTGTFIGAANFLCRLTGDKSYLKDAEKAADFTRDRLCYDGILPKYGGGDASGFNGIFVRWLARFAGDNHLWGKYHAWMVQNANAAWNNRRSDNLGWNLWQTRTPDGPLQAWACSDTVVILQVVPPKAP
jgi:predicted alpha-1,6-mannanase (GH76 family)